jgi:hypothetical protein
MTNRQIATYTASTASARAAFMALAAAVTLAVLTSLGSVADHQFEDVLLAQATHTTVAHATPATRQGA